ncbi:DUF6232 family protein [Dactylosporangium sp. NPDC051541]|uniref:DUF6232 family protein n=1 Tax=Dactylosporangium sp. NPDC051541 TaxID=3363977 RepID=UPI00378B1D04
MPIFFTDPRVRIDHLRFRVLGAEPHDYLLTDLTSVWVVEPAGVGPTTILAVSCSGTAAAAAVVVFAWADSNPALGWVCVALSAVIALLRVRSLRRAPARQHELWADCRRGHAVLLYATTDLREFGRVRRATARALEWRDVVSG